MKSFNVHNLNDIDQDWKCSAVGVVISSHWKSETGETLVITFRWQGEESSAVQGADTFINTLIY